MTLEEQQTAADAEFYAAYLRKHGITAEDCNRMSAEMSKVIDLLNGPSSPAPLIVIPGGRDAGVSERKP